MSKSYEQGIQDGVGLYGRVCSRQSSCDEGCMIGQLKGELSCQEFMHRFPQKMVSLLKEMDKKEYTYFDEYVTRFPNCNLSLQDVSDVMCRKMIFEGFVACEGGDCKACWNERYVGDVTELDDEEDDSE